MAQKKSRKLEKRHPIVEQDPTSGVHPLRDANVWCMIFRLAPQRDIGAICRTCKLFNVIVDEMHVLQHVVVRSARDMYSVGGVSAIRHKLNALLFLVEDLKFQGLRSLTVLVQ